MIEDSSIARQRKEELKSYVKSFYRASWDWRSARYHARWDKYDRNYHSIYDPELLSRKEPWQSKMFIGTTLTNVETITSQLFKTMMTPNPPIELEPGPAGDDLQAKLMEEVVTYEMRKSHFEVNFYDSLKEAIRYGSGFLKVFWDRQEDVRKRKVPLEENPSEFVNSLPPEVLNGQAPMRFPSIIGLGVKEVPVLMRNYLATRYIHIRDIFPEPNTRDWGKVLHRDKQPYQWIMQNIRSGAFFDVSQELENVMEGEQFDVDLQTSKSDRGFTQDTRIKSKYEKRHTIWELWAPIPRKWIQFDIPDGYEAEELVPAKVMVASGDWLLSSEENPDFDGAHPFLKMDYLRTGEPYGKGVCEMILDDQDEINELRNLRVDNVNLIMNKMLAVFEQALVSRKDLISQPGGIIRIKSNVVDDIRKALMPVEFPDVTSSSFRETLELERGVQERTGANRVTLGSSGLVSDTNQTLGGMELLKQMFNERVAAYGMLIEAQFMIEAAEKFYSLCYQNLNPKDLQSILGDAPVQIDEIPGPMGMQPVNVPRYLAFAFVPPEVVARSYRFKPMGIFTMENKTIKAAQGLDLLKLFMGTPFIDPSLAGKSIAKIMGLDEAEKWFQPMPMMPIPQPPLGHAGPPNQKETPGIKGGPNGNQPSFLPPNPDRRQPIAS